MDRNVIEVVSEFKYLGRIMSFEERMDKEASIKITNAWRAFWRLKSIMFGKMLIRLKVQVLESNVLTVRTYDAQQTWAATRTQTNRIKSTIYAMLRTILQIKLKDEIRNEVILQRTLSRDAGYTCEKLQMKYGGGHMARGASNRWNVIATTWISFGNKRGRGRPPTRWRDEIGKRVGPRLIGTAHNRKSWRVVTEAYAQE